MGVLFDYLRRLHRRIIEKREKEMEMIFGLKVILDMTRTKLFFLDILDLDDKIWGSIVLIRSRGVPLL